MGKFTPCYLQPVDDEGLPALTVLPHHVLHALVLALLPQQVDQGWVLVVVSGRGSWRQLLLVDEVAMSLGKLHLILLGVQVAI